MIQDSTVIIIIILGIGLVVSSCYFYFRPNNDIRIVIVGGKQKKVRGKEVTAGFIIVAALSTFFIPTLAMITADLEEVTKVYNFVYSNESGMYLTLKYPNPLIIPISYSTRNLSSTLQLDLRVPDNITNSTVELISPREPIISTSGIFSPIKINDQIVVYTSKINARHYDTISNKTYPYDIKISFLNHSKDNHKLNPSQITIPFKWTIVPKDLAWLIYFWIVLAGVVGSRFISFVRDTKLNEALDIDRYEAIWIAYTFFIAVIAFASFKQNVTLGDSIFFNVIASFVFGFGSDRVVELAKAFPRSSSNIPSQVTGLTVNANGPQRIDLSWNQNNEADLDHYNIYRGTSTGFTQPNSLPQYISNTNSFTDTSVIPGTYYYRVAAVNKEGAIGAESSEGQATAL